MPGYLAKIHGENQPHLGAIETWKAVATGTYWWPTWGHDVCNYLRYCKTCKGTGTRETQPKGDQHLFQQETPHETDWMFPIIQQINSAEKTDHIGTQEELGLLSLDTETYFIIEDGLKYRSPNGKVKMCVTKESAIDWVKMIHEHQVPHATQEEILTQVYKGPYWWPTISPDVEHVIDECKTCQITIRVGPKINDYETTLFPAKITHDWRQPIIQHLKDPMELSNFGFHKELGLLREKLPSYFLEARDFKRRFAKGDIKLRISQEKGIEWLTIIHNQRYPHLSMDEMISHVIIGPYWWPTIPLDIDHLCKGCRICWPNKSQEQVVDCKTITIKEKKEQDWRTPFINYLTHGRLTTEASTTQRQQIAIRSRPYMLNPNGTLIKEGPNGIRRTCIVGPVLQPSSQKLMKESPEAIFRQISLCTKY